MQMPIVKKPTDNNKPDKNPQNIEQRIRDFFNKPLMANPKGATHEK